MENNGLCQCGCGKAAPLARTSNKTKGIVRGQPLKFIHKHHQKITGLKNRGANNPAWRGGRSIAARKYVVILLPNHPRADYRGYVLEHITIAERVLGKPLPALAVVHHIDKNTLNNNSSNLVICQDQSYHHLLHLRLQALRESGNANAKKCSYCKKWEVNPMGGKPGKIAFFHPDCQREKRKITYQNYGKSYYERKKHDRRNLQ